MLTIFKRLSTYSSDTTPKGKTIRNALQTNGTLIDDRWARFLKENNFLVGISIDGPEEIHDLYRYDRAGRASFSKVMAGYGHLQKHGVEHNILTVVHRDNAARPLEVYRFLREIGAQFIQFIPIVERSSDTQRLAPAPQIDEDGVEYKVTPWSVLPRTYGSFLTTIFDEWVQRDISRVFVQFFDMQLGLIMGQPASLCVFAETCGQGLAMEHNGDLYACDHYVYPQFKLGNIMETPIEKLANSSEQIEFGNAKKKNLTKQCLNCDIRFACNGGCPKHRFLTSKDGEAGHNYFCRSTTHFVKHAAPTLQVMANLIRAGRPASDIMPMIRQGQLGKRSRYGWKEKSIGRNDPCPLWQWTKIQTMLRFARTAGMSLSPQKSGVGPQ